MKRGKIVLFFALLVVLTFVYGQDNQPMIGEDAPEFNLKDLNGGMVKLSELQGKFLVIHFAASW